MVKLRERCFSYFTTGLAMYGARVCNAYRISVNDWGLLCLRKMIDQLNYSESYTFNLHHCDSIMEGYQYSMSENRAFGSLLLENYSSFILTIECKEEFTLKGAQSGQDCKETAAKYTFFFI